MTVAIRFYNGFLTLNEPISNLFITNATEKQGLYRSFFFFSLFLRVSSATTDPTAFPSIGGPSQFELKYSRVRDTYCIDVPVTTSSIPVKFLQTPTYNPNNWEGARLSGQGYRVPRAVSRNPGLLVAIDWGIGAISKIEVSFVHRHIVAGLLTVAAEV